MMKYICNERGLTMLYTLFIIVFLTFTVTKSFNNFFHLQFMSKNEHNVARMEYFVLLAMDYLEQLYNGDEEIKSGLLSISDQDIQFELYKTNLQEILWYLHFSFDGKPHIVLLTMEKENKSIVSWIQLE